MNKYKETDNSDLNPSSTGGTLAGIIILAMVLAFMLFNPHGAFGAPMGDADGNGVSLDGRDVNLAVFGNDTATLDIDGNGVVDGKDRVLILRAYAERHNVGLAIYTDPRPGMSFAPFPNSFGVSGGDKVQFGAAATSGKRLVGVNGGLVTTIPTTGRLVGPVVKVNGTKLTAPLVGRLKSASSRGGWWWSNLSLPGSTADATVEWYLEYLDQNGTLQKTATVAWVPSPSFVIRNLRLNPALPEDGQQVTPSVEFGWVTDEVMTGSVIGTLNGVPVDGVTTVTANPVSGTTTVTLPPFVVSGGSNTYHAQLRVGNVISTAEIIFSVQTAPPPVIKATNLVLSPSQPAAGQTVSASLVLATTSAIARAYTASAKIDGVNAGATGGMVPTGSTTRTVTLPAFTATGGNHTYQVSVAVAGVTTTLTRTFNVPLPDFTVASVNMASTVTAGTNITATISCRASNLGAPFQVGLQARRNSVSGSLMASGSVSFTAGQTVTAQGALTLQATAGTTQVVFVIDPDNKFAESNEANAFSQPITVTAPPQPTPPDLVALSATVPATAAVNVPFSVTLSYRADNLPSGNTTATVDVREGSTVLASRAFTFTPGTPVGSIVLPPVTLTTTGTHALMLRLDAASVVAESNEGNNTVTGAVTVVQPPAQPTPTTPVIRSVVAGSGGFALRYSGTVGGAFEVVTGSSPTTLSTTQSMVGTIAMVTGLSDFATAFAAVRAVNASGQRSPLSTAVSVTPAPNAVPIVVRVEVDNATSNLVAFGSTPRENTSTATGWPMAKVTPLIHEWHTNAKEGKNRLNFYDRGQPHTQFWEEFIDARERVSTSRTTRVFVNGGRITPYAYQGGGGDYWFALTSAGAATPTSAP